MLGLVPEWVGCGRAPVHIMANVQRSEALKVLNQEGLLLVLCSLVDNMPYVLAEAAVRSYFLPKSTSFNRLVRL